VELVGELGRRVRELTRGIGAGSFSLGLALRAGVNLMVVMLKVTKRYVAI
jgi:hypothetical protein